MLLRHGIRLLFLLSVVAMLFSCGRENPEPPDNPFDKIDYGGDGVDEVLPDSSTLVGLHRYIFSRSCAIPSCHDGSFEPDFRTVQSTYSTLVFHPVVKNTPDEDFEFRVVPNDVNGSWLHERVTTGDATLGRMPLYYDALPENEIQKIRNWIGAGAPDMFGNVSGLPNTQPAFKGVSSFMNYNGIWVRVDTFRSKDNPYLPFGVLQNSDVQIWLDFEDDSTAVADFMVNEFKVSDDFDDFSAADNYTATYQVSPKVVPNFYGPGEAGYFHWVVSLNTSNYPVGEVSYFRYYLDDGSHSTVTEFPRNVHPLEYKLYMGFYVVP